MLYKVSTFILQPEPTLISVALLPVIIDACQIIDIDSNAVTTDCDTLTVGNSCSVSCKDGYHSTSNPSLTLTCSVQGGNVSASALTCAISMN